jgi:hypothetical protein
MNDSDAFLIIHLTANSQGSLDFLKICACASKVVQRLPFISSVDSFIEIRVVAPPVIGAPDRRSTTTISIVLPEGMRSYPLIEDPSVGL